MEVSTNLGRVALVPRGEYNSSTQYHRLDVIQYKGAGYIVLRDVQGVLPVDGENYMLLVEGSGGSSGSAVDMSEYVLRKNPAFTGFVTIGRAREGGRGDCSIAIASPSGNRTGNIASGESSIAIGYRGRAEQDNQASSLCSIAIGSGNISSGTHSVAIGHYNKSTGENSVAMGVKCYATGYEAVALIIGAIASGDYAYAHGHYAEAKAECQTAIGECNVGSTLESDKFIIGKGNWSSAETLRSWANCFRVTHTGVYASGDFNASGADYAEMFEWADGNPDGQDRAGLFVTLDGDKIRIAGPEDDYITGVVSGDPSVVGDVQDDQWQGMYLYDIFGRPLWEDVEFPQENSDGTPAPPKIKRVQKINPDYDRNQPYTPRSQRPEWDAVGLLGKLVAVDDGSCQVNGWCAVGTGGIAVKSDRPTKYRVMARLDDTHIRVLIL